MSSFEISAPLSFVPGTRSMDRTADLPPDGRTVEFGMNGAVAELYNMEPPTPAPTTLDYLSASIGGCLIGTFGGSLKRARVPYELEGLTGVVVGRVEVDDNGFLALREVTVRYRLELDEEHRSAAEEVLAAHAARCPNARSVSPAIAITTELEIVAPVAR